MPQVEDVAAYLLFKLGGEATPMKLQKLVYYAQAWSLVLDETPLFPEEIQAWANGPVCPSLYEILKEKSKINKIERGNPSILSDVQKRTIDEVVEAYGHLSGEQLSVLTHGELPWTDARHRAGVGAGERCKEVISFVEMAEFYESFL